MISVGIFIDNSNLWIEGKKCYAAKNAMNAIECPHWRIKMGSVVEQLLKGRQLIPGGGHLYGSTPPPTPELWKNFRKSIEVTLYPRSYYTKKEKCVDVDFAASVTEFACDYPDATVILVSGDLDFLPVLKKMKKRNVPVELWAWKSALSHELRDFDYDKLTVQYLDDIVDLIGFTNSEWNLTLEDIPTENSIVFPNYAEKDCVAIAELLAGFNIPFYHFEVDNRDMVIVFNCGLGERELAEYVTLGEEFDVVPYITWKQVRKAQGAQNMPLNCKLAPERFNPYSGLDDDDEEEGEKANDLIESLNEPSEWIPVETSKKHDPNTGPIFELCMWGKYCKKYMTGECRYLHTKLVHEYFRVTRYAKTVRVFTECNAEACHGPKGPNRCPFWHPGEKRLCPTCDSLSLSQHKPDDCPITLHFKKRKEEEEKKVVGAKLNPDQK